MTLDDAQRWQCACRTMHNADKTLIGRVYFQLECGKKYGINFRIIAPTAMETKLMESFLQSCSVPAEEVEATCPAEDRPLVEYVYITTFWKVLKGWKGHFVQFSRSQVFSHGFRNNASLWNLTSALTSTVAKAPVKCLLRSDNSAQISQGFKILRGMEIQHNTANE